VRDRKVLKTVVTFLVLFSSTGLCQQDGKPFEYSKRVLDAVSEQYGISQALSTARQGSEAPISDLSNTSAWLAKKYPDFAHRVQPGIPLREFRRSFAVTFEENESYRRLYSVFVHIRLRDTPEAAGRAAAAYFVSIAVMFDKGSFSGSPVGDWTASIAGEAGGADLIFIRRNAFMQVAYQGPYEFTKSDRSYPSGEPILMAPGPVL